MDGRLFTKLDVFAEILRTSAGIEDRAEQYCLKKMIETGRQFPVSHQNESGDHVDHGRCKGDQREDEISNGSFSECRHFGIVEKEKRERTDGNVAERMIEIFVIIRRVHIGSKQKNDPPERRREGECFFCRCESGIPRGVEEKIYGAEEKQCIRKELCISEQRSVVIFQKASQIKREENADRKKYKSEKRTGENGALVLRSRKWREFQFPHDNSGCGEDDENEEERQSDREELRACLRGVFIVVRIVITNHQDRSPNRKNDAGQKSDREITEQDFFYAQCKDTSFFMNFILDYYITQL